MGTQNLSSDELREIINNQHLIIDDKTEAFLAYEQTWQHIDLVMRLLASAQIELMKRAVTHDRTKLITPEREMFAEMTNKLRELTYGSPEYKDGLEQMKRQALGHHYEHNRHHPEFFEPRKKSNELERHIAIAVHTTNHINPNIVELDDIYGYEDLVRYLQSKQLEHVSSVNNMNLFDLIEMFIDWNAACQRHADGDIDKSIKINTARFALSPQLVEIFKNTIPWVQDAFAGLNTQQDIQPPK